MPSLEASPDRPLHHRLVPSPLGPVLVVGDATGLRRIVFQHGTEALEVHAAWGEGGAIVIEAARQLEQYFAGERHDFELELAPEGTDFQLRVWSELERIAYGEVITYGELARRIGSAKASRAVGSANGRNPLPIVVPCHRVVAANGKLGGFTGGLDLKRGLLALEARATARK